MNACGIAARTLERSGKLERVEWKQNQVLRGPIKAPISVLAHSSPMASFLSLLWTSSMVVMPTIYWPSRAPGSTERLWRLETNQMGI